MIYIIDDKIKRQIDFGWNESKFSEYSDFILPIYNYKEILDKNLSSKIFKEGNTVLFHESFFENTANNDYKEKVDEVRNRLNKFAQDYGEFNLVFFSGSKSSRKLDKNVAYLPVSILYQNLKIYIEEFKKGNINLKFLLYGKNYNIEEKLLKKLIESNRNIINDNCKILAEDKRNVIFRTEENQINQILPKTEYKALRLSDEFDFDVDDDYLNFKIVEILSGSEFDNIFIPLCFGPTLSDYNGLRMAAHIRCTKTPNQLKNIFIYSFVDFSKLIENECFDILKTKNVFLIDYSKNAFQKVIEKNQETYKIEELPSEIKKLNLPIPLNYQHPHSIANEWAIYKWAKTIRASDKEIDKIESNFKNNLYLKYLQTIHAIAKDDIMKGNELTINYEGEPKVLYIDDEAEKGWYEIFCRILDDENKLTFRHLDDEFNGKSKDEIIDISMKTIIDENIDLVILDFRLHKSDFENNNVEEVTGYQILNKIKEFNKGIQVIIFSATNKIWNLQALQEAGSDGFIIKESPENSVDPEFTIESIQNMIKSIDSSLGMMFLKEVCNNIDSIKLHLLNVSNDCDEKEFEKLLKMKFKNEIFIQLDIIYDCLKKSSIDISTIIKDENSYLNLSFISIFKIIELINDFYTNENGDKLRSGRVNIQNYDQNLNAFNNITNQYPSTREKIMTIINFELNESPIIFVSKINQFIKFRNNIIHPKTLKDYKKTSKEENLEFLKLVKSILVKIK